MTYEDYKKALKAIHDERDRQVSNLVKLFISENAKFKVGDIIMDCGHTILVDEIKPSRFAIDDCPNIYYMGKVLTKKLEPNKRGERVSVFESNAILVKHG